MLETFDHYWWGVAYPLLLALVIYAGGLKRGWIQHAWGQRHFLPLAETTVYRLRVIGRFFRRTYNRERSKREGR
jgi:hypothetical protein